MDEKNQNKGMNANDPKRTDSSNPNKKTERVEFGSEFADNKSKNQ